MNVSLFSVQKGRNVRPRVNQGTVNFIRSFTVTYVNMYSSEPGSFLPSREVYLFFQRSTELKAQLKFFLYGTLISLVFVKVNMLQCHSHIFRWCEGVFISSFIFNHGYDLTVMQSSITTVLCRPPDLFRKLHLHFSQHIIIQPL